MLVKKRAETFLSNIIFIIETMWESENTENTKIGIKRGNSQKIKIIRKGTNKPTEHMEIYLIHY